MRVVIVVVIVIISMFMPYLAQILPGKCWERMVTCGSDDDMTDKEKEKDCCKAFIREMDEIECICTGAIYIYVANATAYEDLNVFLSSCNVNTLDVLCPGMGLPSSPTSNLLPPPSDDSSLTPPSDKSSLTPPSDDSSPTPKSEAPAGNNLHVIVPAVVASLVVLIVAVVILVVCLCKPKPNVTISTQNGNDFAGASDASLSTVPLVPLPLAIVTDKPINQKEDVVHGELARLASENDDFMTAESLQYEMRTLEVATNNFSDDHIIGRGGFGIVYKGSLLGGREIAVKKLAKGSSQGDTEFKNEVLLLAKLQHRNLVKLVGFCLENKEKILLYEMVPNKSLDYFLFDPKKQGQLNWSSRYNIIKGTARGMLYLHEDSPVRIIHRDLKAANVLLDLDMNPKIADFGLARICANEQTHIDTSRVVGTYGYMAPEYLLHGQYSVKSDVYSFGVLVLEIVCGRKVGDIICKSEGNLKLLSYAWKCWLDAEPLELLDPILKDESCSNDEVIKCIHIGLLCVQEDISKRPPMATITHMLNSQVSVVGALSMPMPPAYLYNSSSNQSTTTRSNTSSSMPWSQSYPHGSPNLECR